MIFCKLENFTTTRKNRKAYYAYLPKEFFLFINAFFTMYILNASKYAIENYLTKTYKLFFGIILMPASILPHYLHNLLWHH